MACSRSFGVRGLVMHVNCVRVNRKFPSRDIPISEGGEIAEGLLWVTHDSQGELEELRLFGPVCEEGPGVSGLLGEGRVASKWYQSRKFLLVYFRQEETEERKKTELLKTL